MDRAIDWFLSRISCLVIKINPIVEKLIGLKINVETDTCGEEMTLDGEKLLNVAGVIGVVVAAIVICGCCCGTRGRTMKAPGRNGRINRDHFERNPANYFRDLRKNR